MFMACVSEHKKIGLWEMKKEDWAKCKTKGGKPSKSIGVEYFLPFIPKIKVAANPRRSQSQAYPKIHGGGGAIF